MIRYGLAVFATLISYTLSISSSADSRMEFNSNLDPQPDILMVKDNKVRMESASSFGRNVSIFDNTKKIFMILNVAQSSYVEMDQATIKAQASKAKLLLEQASKQMQEQLKHMPPEQQQQMRQRIQNLGISLDAEPPPADVEIKRSGKSQQISGITCDVYEAYVKTEKTGEACVANQQALDIHVADYDALTDMFNFMQEMSQQIGQHSQSGLGANPFDQVNGLPIHMNGEQGNSMKLLSISKDALSDDLFQVPANYQKINPAETPQ